MQTVIVWYFYHVYLPNQFCVVQKSGTIRIGRECSSNRIFFGSSFQERDYQGYTKQM